MIELFIFGMVFVLIVLRIWSDRWNIAKDQSVIHIKQRTEYEDQKATSIMKLDAELIRTNSTGLIMYNPKNAAEMLKSMKNKTQTREQKIAERIAYQQAQSQVVN